MHDHQILPVERTVIALEARVDALEKLVERGGVTDESIRDEISRLSERQKQIRKELDAMTKSNSGPGRGAAGLIDSARAVLETMLTAKNTGRLAVAVLGLALLWWVIVQDGCNTLLHTFVPPPTPTIQTPPG